MVQQKKKAQRMSFLLLVKIARDDWQAIFLTVENYLKKIEKMKNKCVYCGEREAEIEIPNPNFDEIDTWKVCNDCKEIIHHQQGISIGTILNDDKIIAEHNLAIEKIVKRTGVPVINVKLSVKIKTMDMIEDKFEK